MSTRTWLARLTLLGLLSGPACAADKLLLLTEYSPPGSMEVDGQVAGFAADKIREMVRRAGLDYEMRMMPWKRAYVMAQTQPLTCAFSMTRTPERANLFKWIGPTHDNDWTLFALRERHYQFKSLADIGQLRIGVPLGDIRGDYLQSQGFRVEGVQQPGANPRKLLLGRIDLWATSLRVGHATLAANGWQDKIEPVLTFRRTQMYLACAPSMPDAMVARLNAALEAMKHDGTARAIDKKYEKWQDPMNVDQP